MHESCSISILICHTCHLDGLSYWILTNVCSTSETSNYFVFIKEKKLYNCLIQLVRETGATNKALHFYFCIFSAVFTVCSRCPQMTQKSFRFETWCTVTTSLSLCPVFIWTFTANFTPSHTLQYEISCWHLPWWSPASPHQHRCCCWLRLNSDQPCWEKPA